MKLFTFSAAAVIATCASSVAAQSFSVPQPFSGASYEYVGFDAGPEDTLIFGNNAVWDFSGEPDNSTYAAFFYRLPTQDELMDFPEATMVQENPETEELLFLAASSDSLVLLGNSNGMFYPDPRVILPYPFESGTSYTDSFIYHYPSGMSTVYAYGNLSMEETGAGTLLTAYGDYTNVRQLRRNLYVEFYVNGTFVTSVSETAYLWYDELHSDPLLLISYDDYHQAFCTRLLSHHQLLEVQNNEAVHLSIYPNPATGNITIDHPNSSWELFNTLGQQLLSGSGQTVSLGDFPAGLYHLRVITEKGTVSKNVVKE